MLKSIIPAFTFFAFAGAPAHGQTCCPTGDAKSSRCAAPCQPSEAKPATLALLIEGMASDRCAASISEALDDLEGVRRAELSSRRGGGVVEYNAALTDPGRIMEAVRAMKRPGDDRHYNVKRDLPSGRVSFFEVPLECLAAPEIGCGPVAKPLLSALEAQPGVSEAWLNYAGTALAIVWAENANQEQREGALRLLLSKGVNDVAREARPREITGAQRAAKLDEFLRLTGAWYRDSAIHALIEYEAEAIAQRLVRRVQAQVALNDAAAQAVGQALVAAAREHMTQDLAALKEWVETRMNDDLLAAVRPHLDDKGVVAMRKALEAGFRPLPNEDGVAALPPLIARDCKPSASLVPGQSGCASQSKPCCGETAPSCSTAASPRDQVERKVIVLGDDLSALRAEFNKRSDRWRVVALVSPTCSECVYGAEVVRKEIVDRYPPDRVEIISVWIPMLSTDNEQAARASATILPADRAVQFYDSRQSVGWAYARGTFKGFIARARKSLPPGHYLEETFADREQTEQPQWDLYMLYAPGIRWDDAPPMPTHWIRHCGRSNGQKSTYWRDSPDSPPRAGNLFDAMREMADQLSGAVGGSSLRLEILGFDGCPTTPVVKANVDQALASLGIRADIIYIDQQKLPGGDLRRGWPTPTVLVRGRDLFGMQPPQSAAMSCRAYARGAPSAAEIATALKSLTRQSTSADQPSSR